MNNVRRAGAVLLAVVAFPVGASEEFPCVDLWEELRGATPFDGRVVDDQLVAPQLVRIEEHASGPGVGIGCGDPDLCEGRNYQAIFVMNIPQPLLSISLGSGARCDGFWVEGRPVEGEPGVFEFREPGNPPTGTSCLRSIDERGYRTPRALFEYEDFAVLGSGD